MYSLQFHFIIATLLSVLAYFKLKQFRNQSEFHNFDLNATLPIRGILAILVVSHHIGQHFEFSPMGILSSFGPALVSTFFFISGYGLITSYQKKGRTYLHNFFQHRFGKLLPLFLILTIACTVYVRISRHQTIFDTIYWMLHGWTPLPYSWFMYIIIFQYIAFYIACKTSHTKLQCIEITAILTLSSIIGLIWANFNDTWWTSQSAFVLGMIGAAYEGQLRKVLSKHPLTIVATVLALALLGIVNQMYAMMPANIALFLFPNLMSILVLFVVYAYGTITNNTIRFLGKISLEIYLIQGIAIVFVEQFNMPWYTFATCVFAITIPTAAVAHKFSKMISSHF